MKNFETLCVHPLKDKNDKHIYEEDLLRIKGKMGDKGEYSFDAIYRVNKMSYEFQFLYGSIKS